MNCEQANQLLSVHYDGELEGALAADVANHVAQCRVCASELARIRMLGGLIRSSADRRITSAPAPNWHQFVSRLESAEKVTLHTDGTSFRKLMLISAAVLVASMLLFVTLSGKKNSGSATHEHNHAVAGGNVVVVDFEKLLNEDQSQPMATLDSLSNRFEGTEAALNESESQLGYEPSISHALPSGVKLVLNRVLKLPHCNCASGACTCGPAGCNCAASLCKRADGSEFLVVEHCATQNVSFGALKSELMHAEKSDVQLIRVGTQLIASWISDRRRLTAIGLNDKSEVQTIVSSIAARSLE